MQSAAKTPNREVEAPTPKSYVLKVALIRLPPIPLTKSRIKYFQELYKKDST